MQTENWKSVKNYEGLYEVSSLGRVRSLERKFIRVHPKKNEVIQEITYKPNLVKFHLTLRGYCRVGIYKDGIKKNYLVHRLVADAFIKNDENKEQVNHKNGVKCDNSLSNLEWCTNIENRTHSYLELGNLLHNNLYIYEKEL
jgi:hypothetical protein